MPVSDELYADRVFLVTSIAAIVGGISMIAVGVTSLVTDFLGTALTVVAFSSAGLAFGAAWHLAWLRYRLRRDTGRLK